MANPLNFISNARTSLTPRKYEDYVYDEALDIQFSMRNIPFVPFVIWSTSAYKNEMFPENKSHLKKIGYRIFQVKDSVGSESKTSQVYIIANPLENIMDHLEKCFKDLSLIEI